jgi:anti-sigma factor RsiW
MSHLKERIAEYVFGELSSTEMSAAKRHLAECADCSHEVDSFQRTCGFLQRSTDVEPPRRIVFEAEKPSSVWRWLAPLGAAAALILAVLIALPIQVQWQSSQVIIAFGEIPQNAAPAPVLREPVAQPVDYERIIAGVSETQQAWLANELRKWDAAHSQEIQRLYGDIVYLESRQRVMYRDTLDNAQSIQLLARDQLQE